MDDSGMEDCGMLDAFNKRLCGRLGKQRYATWIEGAVQFELRGDQLLLRAPTAFERDLVRRRFLSDIRSTASETWGPQVEVCYVLDEGATQATTPQSASADAVKPPRSKKANHTPPSNGAPTTKSRAANPFAEWISGIPTAEAEGVCRRLLQGEFAATPVLMWGSSGVGKTHLLRALATSARNTNRKQRVLALTAEQFLVSFVDACRGGGLPSFRQKHRGVDLLLVDNVQEFIGKRRTLEEFQHTIDSLLADGARVVVTSDRGPNELRELGPELASRLLGGVVTEVGSPDVEMRGRLIRRLAQDKGLELDYRVVERLAGRLVGGAREATGALHRLELLSESQDRPIDCDLADRIANEVNRVATPPVRLDDIQNAVCSVFGLEASTLKSTKRTKAVAEPRMLAMWLARKMTRSAWSEIGDYFGRRSHSTVISAHRRVERLLASSDPTPLCGPAGDLHEAIRRVEAVLRTA